MGGPLGRTSRSTCCVVDEDAQGDAGDGGARTDVVGPPPGELFSETNDNSVALLLTYGTARVLLAGDAAAMGWLREHA
jgi:beta-lactamase superfamily II metal-dependent hydrolase